MDSVIIDNSDGGRIDKCITWQFDNATNLIALIDSVQAAYDTTTKDLWDEWLAKHTNIEQADSFGLSLIGKLVNLQCPTYVNQDGERVSATDGFYRKLIKAKFKLLAGNGSVADYCAFIAATFGADKVAVVDCKHGTMTLGFDSQFGNDEHTEERFIFDQCFDDIIVYPAGVRYPFRMAPIFGFDGQKKVSDSDPEVGGFNEACGFL